MSDIRATITAIDQANREDPNQHQGEPLSFVQGVLASGWLAKLDADASPELQLVVRAHHLRRWELARSDFPEGREGYLRWRRENKAHQADSLAALMEAGDWTPDAVERSRKLLARTKLRTDPETQTLEDAACLVFLQTQFDDMATRTEHDHLVSIVAKTLKKMSPPAIELAGSIELSEAAQAVLGDAVATLTA